ncbi:MAG: YggS family pyridoxal phosphate-dependent enzyme [Gemmataceae bacterium]|nr:YggS family pyridoxal phosphate-dependent enzyme [Gemmataceae bacterium]MDW8267278.1 YggS family pyridoxal phosphate-dependent enzyme [Gemmataceae bacterium]
MSHSSLATLLRQRLAAVEERLGRACQRAGRPRSSVTLVAVTKSISVEIARLLPELGVRDLGENRPQELWRKAAALPRDVRWHLIGHWQRNKIERTLPLVYLCHSADSIRLLDALEQAADRQGRTVPVLLEVNASREPAKHGFAPEEVPPLVPRLNELRRVVIRGLMTMAAYEEDPERCRRTFRELRELRDALRARLAPLHRLDELSMGMTNDFEVAIEEGATMVRIGTALFGGLPAPGEGPASPGGSQDGLAGLA